MTASTHAVVRLTHGKFLRRNRSPFAPLNRTCTTNTIEFIHQRIIRPATPICQPILRPSPIRQRLGLFPFEQAIPHLLDQPLSPHILKHRPHNLNNPLHNLLHIALTDNIWRTKQEMIAQPPVRGAVGRKKTNVIPRLEASIRHTLCEVHGGGERRLGVSIGNELNAPEKSLATDIADVGVRIEAVVEEGAEKFAHASDVGHEVVFLDDTLDLEGGGATDGEVLEGLPVREAAASLAEGFDDLFVDEDGADGRVAGSEGFADDFHVRWDAFGLPGVASAGAAKAAHDFVVDEEGAVAVADVFHGFEIAW